MFRQIAFALTVGLVLTGCRTVYRWSSGVPDEMRAVSVPVFRNASDVTGLGAAVTTQVLREIQREGSLRVAAPDDCAVEIQGEVRSDHSATVAYERRTGARTREHRFTAVAVVSVVDKKSGKTLIDKRKYTAGTTFLANDDVLTGERDASGRLAEDFARQIVDDVLMVLSRHGDRESVQQQGDCFQ